MKLTPLYQRSAGFAYLWVLILVAILGVTLAAASSSDALNLRREKERELLFIGHQFRQAIANYYQVNQSYPTDVAELLTDSRFPNKRHLRKIYFDPMTGQQDWQWLYLGDRIVGVHSASPSATLKRNGFDVADQAFNGKTQYSQWHFTYPPNLLLQ